MRDGILSMWLFDAAAAAASVAAAAAATAGAAGRERNEVKRRLHFVDAVRHQNSFLRMSIRSNGTAAGQRGKNSSKPNRDAFVSATASASVATAATAAAEAEASKTEQNRTTETNGEMQFMLTRSSFVKWSQWKHGTSSRGAGATSRPLVEAKKKIKQK